MNKPGDYLSGLEYKFSLASALDSCPEYLVHVPTLAEIANKEFDLELVGFRNFGALCHDILALIDQDTIRKNTSGPNSNVGSQASSKINYGSSKLYINNLDDLNLRRPCQRNGETLTLSKEEWEVITLYCALELRPLR